MLFCGVFIKRIKSAVPVMFEIMLMPSSTPHRKVGKVRVNDNIKKMKPSDTKTRPIFLLFNFITSMLYMIAIISDFYLRLINKWVQ